MSVSFSDVIFMEIFNLFRCDGAIKINFYRCFFMEKKVMPPSLGNDQWNIIKETSLNTPIPMTNLIKEQNVIFCTRSGGSLMHILNFTKSTLKSLRLIRVRPRVPASLLGPRTKKHFSKFQLYISFIREKYFLTHAKFKKSAFLNRFTSNLHHKSQFRPRVFSPNYSFLRHS